MNPLATRLYVRSAGAGERWHIIRHPPRRGDPIWAHRAALCGAIGAGTPWSRAAGWYEHAFGRGEPPAGPLCAACRDAAFGDGRRAEGGVPARPEA